MGLAESDRRARGNSAQPFSRALAEVATAKLSTRRRVGDRVFARLSTASGLVIVTAIVLIAVFLLAKAIPSLAADQVNFLTSTEFSTTDPEICGSAFETCWW